MTNISAQNAEWLANRPMWQVDKQDAKLLKHPTRWLASTRAWAAEYTRYRSYGWLTQSALSNIKHNEEIQNSKAKRK